MLSMWLFSLSGTSLQLSSQFHTLPSPHFLLEAVPNFRAMLGSLYPNSRFKTLKRSPIYQVVREIVLKRCMKYPSKQPVDSRDSQHFLKISLPSPALHFVPIPTSSKRSRINDGYRIKSRCEFFFQSALKPKSILPGLCGSHATKLTHCR
jgi:hypothetical protein